MGKIRGPFFISKGASEMVRDNMDMDQNIPTIRQWVEERVVHYIHMLNKRGDAKVLRHPNQDVQGVLIRVSVEGQNKSVILMLLESTVQFDKPGAERQIEGFVRDKLPALEKA